MKTIFVVDDLDTNLTVANEVLKNHYKVITMPSAARMFALLEKIKPDLILLDIEMPETDGFEALRRLKENEKQADIPVIFLSVNYALEAEGFLLGAVDFIIKPFSAPVLLNRIKTHLNIDELIRERTKKLVEQTEELLLLKNGIVFTMADLVENRDKNTGGHVDRTAMYMKILIDEMRAQDIYADEIQDWNIDSVISSARLHDIGKIIISDSILNKPGKLTEEEYEIMKTHSTEGARIIDDAIRRTGNAEFLNNARIIALYHHERWDGSGYPCGLKETDIPLLGRMVAVIDVYDAIVSARSYKEALPNETAVFIIMQESGRHFDPVIAEAFVNALEKYYQETRDY